MPFAKVTSRMGKTKFKDTISTPNSEEAKQIDAGLSTIVFFHPVFLAEYIFQAQFSNQRLSNTILFLLILEVMEKPPEIQHQIGSAGKRQGLLPFKSKVCRLVPKRAGLNEAWAVHLHRKEQGFEL
ncbi:hypothetical protein F5051DRAFT_434106 [Lentinula edodes]|nr:hypothetical protein F5051DRAFT_434106 [Lentinula edodes]